MTEVNGASADQLAGIVKWFNTDKGYGFIKRTGGTDVFVHVNQLKKSGISRPLNEGDKVNFVIDKGQKGSFATNITVVES